MSPPNALTSRNAGITAVTVLVVFTLAGLLSSSISADLKHKPWIEKDWTQWSATDCEYVRVYSPWADYNGHQTAPSESPTGQIEQDWILLLSALPEREMKLRELQLEKSYSRMNPTKKQAFDDLHATDLVEHEDDPVRIYVDKHITDDAALSSGYAVQPPLRQAALKLSDGAYVPAIEILPGDSSGILKGGVIFVFPRTLNGRPLYSTSDKNLTIVYGCALTPKTTRWHLTANDIPPFYADCGSPEKDEFPIAPMIYKGKLEY